MVGHNILISILVLILMGCSLENEDSIAKSYFSASELTELDKIVDFIAGEMKKNCDQDQVSCLYDYFKIFENIGAADDPDFLFDRNRQHKVLWSLDKELFNEIWLFCEGQTGVPPSCQVDTYTLCLKPKSRFGEYLLEVTKSNPKLSVYYEPFEIMGFYTAAMNGNLVWTPEIFNLNSRDHVRLVAIHLFTISFPTELR